jgi:hypothetical protein
VLRARGEAEAAVVRATRARGQAQAISTVFRALHEGKPDQKLLAYQYLQALPELARGDSNKIWIVPSEIGKALEGIGNFFGAVPSENSKTETDGEGRDEVDGAGNLTRLTAAKELAHEPPEAGEPSAGPMAGAATEPGPDLDRT